MKLLSNAVDAMPTGGTIRFHGYAENGFEILEISDTGAGMDEETQKRCFEPFFSTKPAVEGTGLGLSVSYGIVKRHGGDITANSARGKGTLFTITLPIDGVPGEEDSLPIFK